jgi:DNA polymerase III delta prime subunit
MLKELLVSVISKEITQQQNTSIQDIYIPEIDDDIQKETQSSDLTVMMGGASKETIKEAQEKARIILTTYGYSGTGVSIVKQNAIVFATPRKSNMIQIVEAVSQQLLEE